MVGSQGELSCYDVEIAPSSIESLWGISQFVFVLDGFKQFFKCTHVFYLIAITIGIFTCIISSNGLCTD